MRLVFATHNRNKFNEVRQLMPGHIELISLDDIGCTEPIEETGQSLEENARIKAEYVLEHYHLPCFAEDTGLIVNALGGAPGIYTARYAGAGCSADDNMEKLLAALRGTNDRTAQFKTVIALCGPQGCHFFKGSVPGTITNRKLGQKGFGYDPLFMPDGFDRTFAELPQAVKNKIGHRGKAVRQLLAHLKT